MSTRALVLTLLVACGGEEPCPAGSSRLDDGLCHLDDSGESGDSGQSSDSGESGDSGQSSDSGAPATPTFTEIQDTIFMPSCAFSTCHGDADGVAGIVLTGDEAHAALYEAPAVGKDGAVLVIPGDADNSYLVQKMEDAEDIEGLPMPPAGILDEELTQMVRAWIDAGAADD